MRKDTGLSPRVPVHINGEPGNRAAVNVVLCYLHSLTNQGPQDGGSKGFRMKLKFFVGFSNLVYVLLQCVQFKKREYSTKWHSVTEHQKCYTYLVPKTPKMGMRMHNALYSMV